MLRVSQVSFIEHVSACAGQRYGHVSQSAAGRGHVGQSERVSEGDGPVVAQCQSSHGGPLAGETGTGKDLHNLITVTQLALDSK